MPLSPRAGAAHVSVGAEVQLTGDAALAFQLARGHGGWALPMADCLGRCGTVVDVVNSQGDVRINCGEYGSYVWNPAAIVGPAYHSDAPSVLALDLHPRRLFAAATAHGRCQFCRRVVEGDVPENGADDAGGAEASVAAAVSTVPTSPADFLSGAERATLSGDPDVPTEPLALAPAWAKFPAWSSRDGAFRLCSACAVAYMDPPREASAASDAPPPLDCPGTHGLTDVAPSGDVTCDQCARKVSTKEVLRGCRSCNWGVCSHCLAASRQGAYAPRFDIGSSCRAELKGKPVRAVVVDVRGEPEPNEALLHYPGCNAEANDEWVEFTSQRIIPVEPPAAYLRFHPSHRCGLVPARMPNWPDRGPRCTAEVKFPGGCRRFAANGAGPPLPAVGLYSERDDFFLCPWCASSDLVESVRTVEGVKAGHRADVAALHDPSRCNDAAARIARQCSRSVAALVGLLEAGLVGAIAAALCVSCDSEDGAQLHSVLLLFLDVAEWLFNEPSTPSAGDRVLCERPGGTSHLASVVEVNAADQTCVVDWADSSGAECARQVVPLSGIFRLCGGDLSSVFSRQSRRRSHTSGQRVPPPSSLTRDFLMKKAIPSDNTSQARQYLMDGADLSTLSEAGDGALVLALEHGCTSKMVRLLLEFGCPMTAGATLGEPLQLAARYGQHENLELLLDARADPRTLDPEGLPERAARRIIPLAALLSIGGGGETAAVSAALQLGEERAKLARSALPSLARLLARPPPTSAVEGASQIEARLLNALDALLGARVGGAEGISALSAEGLAHLTELTQRLMTTYSASAAFGALRLIRRLLRGAPLARAELARCGVERFVSCLAEGVPAFCELPASPLEGGLCDSEGRSGRRTDLKITALAREVLRDVESSGGLGTHVNEEVQSTVVALREAIHQRDNHDSARLSALSGLRRLGARLESVGQGATAYELEVMEVPQTLLALLESGHVSGSMLVEQLGRAGCTALAAALLRIVETTEVLPVRPLPPYLSQAPGLRVLCEPLVIVVANGLEANRPQELAPQCPTELEQRWLQVEPLLRVQELERLILMTSPILNTGFLSWCLSLVNQDVAVFNADGVAETVYGRVLDFHLATPLRIPVHTVRRSSDGREVDLVASLHGLAAIDKEAFALQQGLDLRVALLRMEAALTPLEFGAAFMAVREAVRRGNAMVCPAGAADTGSGSTVPPAAKEVLLALGFSPHADGQGLWQLTDTREALAAVLEEIAEQHAKMPGGLRQRKNSGEGAAVVELDSEMVSQLAAIFPEHGAKRACAAVRNSSVEAAMEWACQHQGDPDFNDPFPDQSARGWSADPRAPVWSVFIMLPPGVPFDLVWPMLEDPVKGALTSVANAWTAMGWAGGEVEMRNTLRAHIDKNGEGAIARGLPQAKAERVASRLRNACECRVEADPEGAANAPRVRGGGPANGEKSMVVGARVQLVLEADKLGIVASVPEDESSVDVVTDDGRLLVSLPNDQVRIAPRTASSSSGERRPANFGPQQPLLQGGAAPDTSAALTSVAEPITSPALAPLRCSIGALDRGAQESDVLRRFQPQDLLNGQKGEESGGSEKLCHSPAAAPLLLVPPPTCRVAFSMVRPQDADLDNASLCLLRGERSWVKPGEGPGKSFASTSWLTIGAPGLAITSGAWYYEVELTKFKNPQIGWADASFRFLVGAYSDDGIGDDAGSWAADGERCCLWHRGRAGDWKTAAIGQTICCAISIDDSAQASMWFAVDGAWEKEPTFCNEAFDTYVYPAVSGELDVNLHFEREEMKFGPPSDAFAPLAEVQPLLSSSNEAPQVPRSLTLPPHWTVLQGLYRLAERGLPDAPMPHILRSEVHVDFGPPPLHKQDSVISQTNGTTAMSSALENHEVSESCNPLSLRKTAIEEGLPLQLSSSESDRALEVCGIHSPAARAALGLLRRLQVEPTFAGTITKRAAGRESVAVVGTPSASGEAAVDTEETDTHSSGTSGRRGGSRRLGAKLQSHLGHPLACCSGAFPRWCRELPILTPWLFPLEAREVLLRCYAFGLTFAVWWLQERAVDERFAERRRNMEERLAQAKHIGDAALLNSAYEGLFELQSQITRDTEAWVGSLKSELVKVERDRILEQAERAMELTKASPCALEVQFEGESGFGRAVTQGFYTLVAHEMQRRTANKEAPMWVEDDGTLNEVSTDEFLCPRRGLFMKPLPVDDPRHREVERRFCMLGRLMAKALREGFVVPLPLTAAFFQLVLGGATDPHTALPRPGDGVEGSFLGACVALVADASQGPVGRLAELSRDPEWSRKYMQPPGEEPIPAYPFEGCASNAVFVETGLAGVELCPNGSSRTVTVENVEEFVRLASSFWLDTGVQRQLVAFRRGLYDVLGAGAVALWAFGPAELRRLFCGEDEVIWTAKELADNLHSGGGFSQDSVQLRWLREELIAMAQPLRAKFLEFVTSCPRLPPGGLKELQMSIHPDLDHVSGLPRSRACAHRLFLPRYASREELARQLNEAILSSGGHHEQQLPP